MLASRLIELLEEAKTKAGDHECAIIDASDPKIASTVDGIVFDDTEGCFIICNDAQFSAIKDEGEEVES